MTYRYNTDEHCLVKRLTWRERFVIGVILIACAIVLGALYLYGSSIPAAAAERDTPTSGVAYDLMRSGQFIQRSIASKEACDALLIEKRAAYAQTKTSGSERWICREDRWTTVSYVPNPVACAAPPSPRQATCPTGSTGSWTQTAIVGPAPTCAITWQPSAPPETACVPVAPAPSQTTLTWTPPTRNVDGSALTNLAGYRLFYGRSEAELTQSLQINNPAATRFELSGLASGTWYFMARAYRSDGVESANSNVVSKVIP